MKTWPEMAGQACAKERINTGMDRQYPWKRTNEIEIDLADLLQKLCGQWKRIAACALVSAAVIGGYGWMKGRDMPDEPVPGVAEEAGLPEAEETVLTQAEKQGVEDALRLRKDIQELETYLDNSILMQLDPYHKARCIMLYCIDDASEKELPRIAESYLNFILNGGAADVLAESGRWNADKSYLAEVVQAYQKTYSSSYQIITDGGTGSRQTANSLFYVEITGRNGKKAEKTGRDMEDVLKEYSRKVNEDIGRHSLTLISSVKSMTADSSLQSQQHDKNALLSSNKASLKALTDAFSEGQTEAYQQALYAEGSQLDEELDAEAASGEILPEDGTLPEENSVSVMKYILLGLMGGSFVYCCIFSCWYIFQDTVKSADEIKRMYTFPLYGQILLGDRRGKDGIIRHGAHQDAYGCTETQVMNRVRLACQKHGITQLCAAADFPLEEKERECLESMAEELQESGIHMTVSESLSSDTGIWDMLAETGNVLMVCRTGTTAHRMIDDGMSFYSENSIAVTGAVVFSRNE